MTALALNMDWGRRSYAAWLRLPLAWVLVGLGAIGCIAAYRSLGR